MRAVASPLKLGLALLALSSLSACTTTTLLDNWQDPQFSRNDLDNLLVVALTSNQTARFLFESEIERRATDGGLNVTKSLDVLGDELPERDDMETYIAANEIDYVMVTRLANVEEEKEVVPESVRTYYTGPYYSTYGHYYGSPHDTITLVRESYVDTRRTFLMVTTIFDAATEKPVWVGRSKTFEPGSVVELAGDIGRSTWANISR